MQPQSCPKLVENGRVDIESDVIEYILMELEIFHNYTINITAVNAIGNSTCVQDITTLPACMYSYHSITVRTA